MPPALTTRFSSLTGEGDLPNAQYHARKPCPIAIHPVTAGMVYSWAGLSVMQQGEVKNYLTHGHPCGDPPNAMDLAEPTPSSS